MKVVFGLFVLVGLGIFLAFQFGGVGSFDPAAQAKKLTDTVKPGMTWQQVEALFPPKKFRVVFIGDSGFPQNGQDVKYDRASIEKELAAGGLKLGFGFVYTFGAESQLDVSFDGEGKVESVDRRMNMSDLLSPK